MPSHSHEEPIVDARSDLRWSKTVESLAERQELKKLWHFAKKTPPVWTVRIIKFLTKQSWKPAEDDELEFFEKLCHYASACNEYDLPSPDERAPKFAVYPKKFCTARITSDGDYVYLVDYKASSLEILRADDLELSGIVRLDMWKGRQIAILGIDVGPCGEKVGILYHNPAENKTGVRILSIDFGELIGSTEMNWDGTETGTQVPRIAFDTNGKYLAVLTGAEQIRIIDVRLGKVISQFPNTHANTEKGEPEQIAVSVTSSIKDWQLFGRRSMQNALSRNIAITSDGAAVATTYFQQLMSWDFHPKNASGEIISARIAKVSSPARDAGHECGDVNASNVDSSQSKLRQTILETIAKAVSVGSSVETFKDFLNSHHISSDEIYKCIAEKRMNASQKELDQSEAKVQRNTGNPAKALVFVLAPNGEFIYFRDLDYRLVVLNRTTGEDLTYLHSDSDGCLAISEDSKILAHALPRAGRIHLFHMPDRRPLGTVRGLLLSPVVDLKLTSGGSLILFNYLGRLQTWEADGNGNAWPWSRELVKITHQPADESSLKILREAQEMRRRGWLTQQEEKLLDLALLLMENRLNLDIEIDWSDSSLPGDDCDIQIEEIGEDD